MVIVNTLRNLGLIALLIVIAYFIVTGTKSCNYQNSVREDLVPLLSEKIPPSTKKVGKHGHLMIFNHPYNSHSHDIASEVERCVKPKESLYTAADDPEGSVTAFFIKTEILSRRGNINSVDRFFEKWGHGANFEIVVFSWPEKRLIGTHFIRNSLPVADFGGMYEGRRRPPDISQIGNPTQICEWINSLSTRSILDVNHETDAITCNDMLKCTLSCEPKKYSILPSSYCFKACSEDGNWDDKIRLLRIKNCVNTLEKGACKKECENSFYSSEPWSRDCIDKCLTGENGDCYHSGYLFDKCKKGTTKSLDYCIDQCSYRNQCLVCIAGGCISTVESCKNGTEGSTCGPFNCSTCCNGPECVKRTTTDQCGIDGLPCSACGEGDRCEEGECRE